MGSRDHLKLGDWNAICDQCGFKYKASELKQRWDGFMVCPMDWEPRPPQEYIKGIKDDQTVPFTRPEVTPNAITGYEQALAGAHIYTSANLGSDQHLLIEVIEQLYGVYTQGAVTITLDSSFMNTATITVSGVKTAGAVVTIINNTSGAAVKTVN